MFADPEPSTIEAKALPSSWVKPELRHVVREMPDACERLEYVGKMTEKAANRVLALIDDAKPACDEVRSRGQEIADAMTRLADSPDFDAARARVLMRMCAEFATRAATFADKQNSVLTEVMMAQDFQDLSGQVINKVMAILWRAEEELRHVLDDGALPEVAPAQATGQTEELKGVQVPDRAMQQDDVDDLLASMGF
ncbi:MAG: chemotaxis protein CheZ [Burkholderiales bacterium PBB6]|nr:MAG: chemotaxis protein CheZ [Burkholderiales bacterium PBB6]